MKGNQVTAGQRLLSLVAIGLILFTLAGASILVIAEVTNPQAPQTVFTDEEILDAVYSEYRYPQGFYQEDLQGASIYYENTVSVVPPNQRSVWIELSTDNRTEALEWSESSSRNSAYYRDLVDERETEKFFEFKRVYSEYPSDIVLSRVHKRSYLDRSEYDLLCPGPTLGTFNQRPVTMENAKGLAEYLWFIENYQTCGAKVMNSSTEDHGDSIKHTIYETQVVFGDWGISDAITLIKSEYSIDKNSGEITLSQTDIRTVEGRSYDLDMLPVNGPTHAEASGITSCFLSCSVREIELARVSMIGFCKP